MSWAIVGAETDQHSINLLQVSPGKFIPVWLLDRYRFVESAKFSAV
jgi:hypothetical protein